MLKPAATASFVALMFALTGISTAYQVGFARAYVLHDPKQEHAKSGALARR